MSRKSRLLVAQSVAVHAAQPSLSMSEKGFTAAAAVLPASCAIIIMVETTDVIKGAATGYRHACRRASHPEGWTALHASLSKRHESAGMLTPVAVQP